MRQQIDVTARLTCDAPADLSAGELRRLIDRALAGAVRLSVPGALEIHAAAVVSIAEEAVTYGTAPVYIMCDQPPTCGHCGARVELEAEPSGKDYAGPVFRGTCGGCQRVELYQDEPEPDGCQTCANAIETRAAPCDECGAIDGEE